MRFDPLIVRGFDYYTSTVFEVFDTHPDNRRSLFGGGRYDNLVGLYSAQRIPGLGFGMGDVTLFDFLGTHGLLPEARSEIDAAVIATTPSSPTRPARSRRACAAPGSARPPRSTSASWARRSSARTSRAPGWS